MDPTVIAALLSLAGSTIGTFAGIVVSSKLTNYRLEQLEAKVAAACTKRGRRGSAGLRMITLSIPTSRPTIRRRGRIFGGRCTGNRPKRRGRGRSRGLVRRICTTRANIWCGRMIRSTVARKIPSIRLRNTHRRGKLLLEIENNFWEERL